MLKELALNFDKKKLPGIKSIKKYPTIDQEMFKTYGKIFLQKYFLDDGKKPNKMIAFGAKDGSFSKTILFILFDLKMQPAIFFEFKDDFNEEGFLKFVGELISKSKFTFPKGKQKVTEGDDFLTRVPALVSGIMLVISVFLTANYYFERAKYAAQEYYVNTTVESELNKQLFKDQEKNESGFEMFANLENYLNLIITKKMNSLILCGPPGMSKTYMVRRGLYFSGKIPGKDYRIEKGSSLGIASIYQLLYDNRSKLLILDDFDTPLSNEDIINLMKAITDSYGKRIVSLPPEKFTGQNAATVSSVANKFEFTGQIVIITNKKKNSIDLALRSRSPVFEVSFDAKQIMKSMDDLLKFISPQVPYDIKLEVLNYIKLLQRNDSKVNITFRSIKGAIDGRVGNPDDWKEMAKLMVDYKGPKIKESLTRTDFLYNIYINE